MGKKATFKKIRRLASQLPAINLKVIHGERVSGADLYKDGVKEVEGKPINPDIDYRRKSVVQQPLNHNRKMKEMYNKYGVDGVKHYVNTVNKFIKEKTEQNEKPQTYKT